MARSRNSNRRNKGAATDTLIGQGCEVTGTLTCEANLRIEGSFNGEIDSQGDITVGEHAVARSNIQAREVVIAGKVYGDVASSGKLTITRTGQMFGDVTASSLIIMEGGALSGTSTMKHPELSTEKSKDLNPRFLQPEVI